MGDPKKTRKHFKRPLKIWDKENIEKEKILKETYGLKNKRELWKAETILRKKRHSARSLLALPLEQRLLREQQLLQSLARIGLLSQKAILDDVLTLGIESLLERRLQTLVWRKGLANTAIQARQFITHGHVAINGKRLTAPGYIVTAEEDEKIAYYGGKKMVLKPVVEDKKKAKKPGETAKEFEEAKPAEADAMAGKSAEDVMKAVREARMAKKEKGQESEGSAEAEGKKEKGEA